MSLHHIPAEQVLERLGQFSDIIDARSPAEFDQDHLPGALNWPTLDDEQRHQIGTEYKQVNAFEAKKRGAAMAARSIAEHIERDVMDKPKDWAPLLYCWRGGKRSGSLGLILDQIGFRVSLIEGGYKAFRAALLADIPRQVGRLQWRVVCGTTGSGKTRLLHALAEQGAQVLDLEGLARHRSSVLGLLPGQSQPSQKAFDTLVWNALRQLSADRVVYVESESKKVGNVAVPESLMTAMRASDCLRLQLADEERVKLLLQDYDFFVRDTGFFCERLDTLVQVKGGDVVRNWQDMARAGQTPEVVRQLLHQHYDPTYQASMQRNFARYAQARTVTARNHSHEAMQELAREIVCLQH
ncbi:MAG: tRNA 2-selenouridine(34) synthase MnmH [Comamonadaceae bacterium]|nr:tRNA 2-selenouridine(34) synthase MnmH [Comamonadaceae bacterium]